MEAAGEIWIKEESPIFLNMKRENASMSEIKLEEQVFLYLHSPPTFFACLILIAHYKYINKKLKKF